MVADDARVWQLLDEPVIAPAPVNADSLAEPLVPQISVLHARCVRIETGIEVVWGVSATRGARNYEADLSYDGGASREPLSPLGPASSGRAPMRQAEGPVTVRARAFGRTGLPGDWIQTTFTTVAPVIDGAFTEIVRLPPIDYEGLTENVRGRIDHIKDVEKYAQGVAEQAQADFETSLNKALEAAGLANAAGAAVVDEAKTRFNEDEALSTRITAVLAKTDDALAAVVSEATARATADSAQAKVLEGLAARVGSNEALIVEERTARADGDSANTSYISYIETTVGSNYNQLLTEQKSRADADTAITEYVSYVESVVGSNYGLLVDERNTRADADSALSTRIESTLSTVGYNYGLLVDETTARANADSALAQRITDVQARTDAGTATGRFSLVAQSGSAGVSARIQALVAVQAGGQTRGAGYYVEVMDNGTSRFVVDANAFYITSNGQSVPAFSFDGQTLTIPTLRVTQGIILPNQVSDKQITTAQDLDPGSLADEWREVPGSAFYVNVDSNPGWAIVATLTTNLRVTANGTNTAYRSVSLEAGIAINDNLYNGRASAVASTGAGGGVANTSTNSTGLIGSTIMEVFTPGQTKVSIRYRFRGDAGCTGRIDFAQIKAVVVKR